MTKSRKTRSGHKWFLASLRWFDTTFLDLFREFRWSYLPPLMVYLAAGISGLTAIAGTFFVKEYLNLSAEYLASLGFWAGIPWVLKMPLGHMVDIIWRWKSLLVYLGASLIAASIAIMYGLVAHTVTMAAIWPVEVWFVLSVLLSPIGYVIQDVVADAMTVEAVPAVDLKGNRYSEANLKSMHTTMQMLGRIAIISGTITVALLNVAMFSGVETVSQAAKATIYAQIYMLALTIPAISIAGVTLGQIMVMRQVTRLKSLGMKQAEIDILIYHQVQITKPNWWIFGGSIVFGAFTITIGLSGFSLAQETIFAGSMTIILFLMHRLLQELPEQQRNTLIGTAIIIFVFRAVPLPGAGATWWEIDILGFDQRFLSILIVITSSLTLLGMVLLRPLIAKRTIAYIVVLLTIAGGLLSLPNIGLFYGLHNWTGDWTNGIVDARFIAILDTALESPLGQIAMIPMLAWIAKNAPVHLKATYFAVMASFTNLALSASSLGTKYMNKFFSVTREVVHPDTGVVLIAAEYSQVGWLLISVASIALIAPSVTILIVQASRFQTRE